MIVTHWYILFVQVFYEAALLYTVAFGHKAHSEEAPSKRLLLFTLPTNLLTEEEIEEVYRFACDFIDGDFSLETQREVLFNNYDYICFFRDRMTGHLNGTLTYLIETREKDGKKFTLIKSGMAFFKRMYTGGPMFYLASLMPCLWQLIKHPSRPVYLMTWTISYQSYLFTAKNVTTYPRYDLPEVPEFERSLLDEFGRKISDSYNPQTFVASRRSDVGRLNLSLNTIPDSLMKNPHVKFFVETNPGWLNGDGLVVCAKVTWKDIFAFGWRIIQRALRPPKDRHRNTLKRSKKLFVSEEEYLTEERKQGNNAERLSDVEMPEPLSPTEEVDVHSSLPKIRKRPKPFVNTKSILMGIDRIDEYSNMEIPL
jgi:hypothetical protein